MHKFATIVPLVQCGGAIVTWSESACCEAIVGLWLLLFQGSLPREFDVGKFGLLSLSGYSVVGQCYGGSVSPLRSVCQGVMGALQGGNSGTLAVIQWLYNNALL